MKRRVLVDIKGGKDLASHSSRLRIRLNLDTRRDIEIFLIRALKIFAVGATIIFLLFGLVRAPSEGARAAQSPEEADAQRKALEAQLADLESQANEQEAILSRYKAQGATLSQEIRRLNARITKLNLEIRAISLSLLQLDDQISETKSQISDTESDIEKNKGNLALILRTLYESDAQSVIEILLTNTSLSDFFGNIDSLILIQDKLRVALQSIIKLKTALVTQREQLALERSDVEALQKYQLASRASVSKVQNEKSVLLTVTKGKESAYNTLLRETKKNAAEIRKQIFQLLGGGELEFGDAYNLAKFAEQATGVRAALILAVLDRESALGRNVGRCVYDKNPYYPLRANNPTTTHPTRDIPAFLQITKELGLDPQNMPVSCPIPSDGAFGGAMGPAQFIPSTWQMYKAKITGITGNNPPSPWRNADAFVATALYLKDAGAGPGASIAQERIAAAKYYAGSRWSRYLWTYGARVIASAQKFEADIAILGS